MSAETELNELEAKVLAVGAGGWLKAVDELRTMLAEESVDIKAAVLKLVAFKIERTMLEAVVTAFGLGRADALTLLSDMPKLDRKTSKAKPSAAALAPVKGLDSALATAVAKAQRLMRADIDPLTALAPLFAAANRVNGSVSDAINRGGNEGATAVADAAGLPTVWVAETNACVDCLAYAGRVCKPGKRFPGGLTYGKKSYYPDAIKGPPRHPHCRCTVEPLRSQEYADALKREADRSVLRGFSLESESMAVRIDAARRLIPTLTPGVDAPKSVIDYAIKAVNAGKFPTRGRPTT